MAALIISNTTSYGGMTNQTTARLLSLNTTMERLKDAIATASSGYDGVAGTQFETAIPDGLNMMPMPNNFGVAPDPAAPGANGEEYRYAVDTLAQAWAAFWVAAEASINQLDNGTMAF
jgi:hypothetical protein